MPGPFATFLHLPVWGKRPLHTVKRILAWADAHHKATGRWPTAATGLVRHSPFTETWAAIDQALARGWRGLPGGQSLARLLIEHRGRKPWMSPEGARAQRKKYRRMMEERRSSKGRATLSIEAIVAWADAYRAATGRWPSRRSGPIRGVMGETWNTINSYLVDGRRGLPGKLTLARVLVRHRGRQALNGPPELTVEQVLGWADSYHQAHGRWPGVESGAVAGAPGLRWAQVNQALCRGHRGLPGGRSLAQLLARHRGVRNPKGLARLSVDQIVAWADLHKAATGKWPTRYSGAVRGAPEENWGAIEHALRAGLRGLPAGSSLSQLLDAQRRGLTLEMIRGWAEAHRRAQGVWPATTSGPVAGVAGESWDAIDRVLASGRRGLPGGMSLGKLFGRSADPALLRVRDRPRLTLDQVVAWGNEYHAATGQWPTVNSGAVAGAPGERWVNINERLRHGGRGLPGGTTLARLFGGRADPARGPGARCPRLTVDQVVAWAEAHHAAAGRWPTPSSGAVAGAPGEKWLNINQALRKGARGLPSGLSLAKLFAPGPIPGSRPALDPGSMRTDDRSRDGLSEDLGMAGTPALGHNPTV
jgi:hypothetical protein